MTKAAVVISVISPERAELLQSKLPFSSIKQGNVIIQSKLEAGLPLNDHLVWLWGMLQNERRLLKRIEEEESKIICQCQVGRGAVIIKPNGAEMLHLLNMELMLEIK
ncbi:hypothetical protein QP938_09340 [Porticoccaceae bacterium LTM1]|nr:hypothetical protein QP938_09340 [Porticoccaceae bacterium LTM1]